MSQAAEKLPISIPHQLASAARKRAGRRGLSSFVARAVARGLERPSNCDAIRVADLSLTSAACSSAQRAGALLAKASMSSANAVDAFVVATALEFDSAVIATGDSEDLRRLSAPYR